MRRREFIKGLATAPFVLQNGLWVAADQQQVVRRPMYPAGGSFVPSDLGATLKLWLKAYGESFSDGDPVGTATDFSGNSNNATQATAGRKPLFKTGIVNSR